MRPPISHDGSDQFMRKGTWTPEEDDLLVAYIRRYGIWNWTEMPKAAGLLRSGKSCRLRWMNYLRPNIFRGNFSKEEEDLILRLHEMMGNKWSAIAARLPGRTDNDIKNYWHTHLKKRIKKHKEMQPTGLMQGMETITPESGTKHYINSPQKEQVPLLPNAIPTASDPECPSATDGSTCSSSASSVQETSPGLWDDQFKSFSMEGFFWMEDNYWPSYTDYLWFEESAYSITSNDEVASDFWDDLFMH